MVRENFNENELLLLRKFDQECFYNHKRAKLVNIVLESRNKKLIIEYIENEETVTEQLPWKVLKNHKLHITKALKPLSIIPFEFFIGLLLSNPHRFKLLVTNNNHCFGTNQAQFIHTYLGQEPQRLIQAQSVWIQSTDNEVVLLSVGDMFRYKQEFFMITAVVSNQFVCKKFTTLAHLLNQDRYMNFLISALNPKFMELDYGCQEKILVKLPIREDSTKLDCNLVKISKIKVTDLVDPTNWKQLKNDEFWFFGWLWSDAQQQELKININDKFEDLKQRIITKPFPTYPTTFFDEVLKKILLPVKVWTDGWSPYKFKFDASLS